MQEAGGRFPGRISCRLSACRARRVGSGMAIRRLREAPAKASRRAQGSSERLHRSGPAHSKGSAATTECSLGRFPGDGRCGWSGSNRHSVARNWIFESSASTNSATPAPSGPRRRSRGPRAGWARAGLEPALTGPKTRRPTVRRPPTGPVSAAAVVGAAGFEPGDPLSPQTSALTQAAPRSAGPPRPDDSRPPAAPANGGFSCGACRRRDSPPCGP